jgi:adenylosuccinate lyase
MAKPPIENVLASRYASPDMVAIWSPVNKIMLERRLWLAVLQAQQALGVPTPAGAVRAYKEALPHIDLEDIAERERRTRHDVKARIEAYNAVAGYEVIHRGMTSRDLTDNVEQLQILRSLRLVRDRLVAALAKLSDRAADCHLAIVGRSHNVPAQITTLDKRLATAGEELLLAFRRLQTLIDEYPWRGIKGPMGTAQDQLDLLGGDTEALAELELTVARHMGFDRVLGSVGQIYPRSLDHAVVAALFWVSCGPSNLATTFRNMAGFELLTEGFQEGQVGSSAMPHKVNPRTCERINGLNQLLLAYEIMVGQLAGHQWQEGDVSDSVVRRVAIPDAFFAADGLLEAFLTVLNEFTVFPAAITRELDRHLPFLATTKILAAAVTVGSGRETAHAAIQEHALAAAESLRQGGPADLFERLGADDRIPFTTDGITALVDDPLEFAGDAAGQVGRFRQQVAEVVSLYPDAAGYEPQPIL